MPKPDSIMVREMLYFVVPSMDIYCWQIFILHKSHLSFVIWSDYRAFVEIFFD